MDKISPAIKEYIDHLTLEFQKNAAKNKNLLEENRHLKEENWKLKSDKRTLETNLFILGIILLGAIIFIAIKFHSPDIDFDPNVL